jgi:hypothetical protein
MAEEEADEFGMIFWSLSSIYLRYEFHIQYIFIFMLS